MLMLAVILSAPAFAATRFYLPSSGAAEITNVTYGPGWTDTTTTTPARLKCNIYKTFTGLVTRTTVSDKLAGIYLCNQYVSDPIAGQTISGFVSGEAAGAVSGNGINAYTSILIKVVSSEGVVRGVLLSLTRGNTIFPLTTSVGRWMPAPPKALSSVTAENGDRIVIEVGISREASVGNRLVSLDFRDDNATIDLTEGGANTQNPWVEFSQDIRFPDVTIID